MLCSLVQPQAQVAMEKGVKNSCMQHSNQPVMTRLARVYGKVPHDRESEKEATMAVASGSYAAAWAYR